MLWWEDDGYDDGPRERPGDLDRESGPNHMTLREGRKNFEEHLHSSGMDRVVPGLNDPATIEGKRRAVEAFDAMTRAEDSAAVDAHLVQAERILEVNRAELNRLYDRRRE